MLDKNKKSTDCQQIIKNASTVGHLNSKNGKTMDIMVTAIVAIIVSIIGALIAVIKRKTIGKIFIYAVLALIIGLPFGYLLTPIIISFF